MITEDHKTLGSHPINDANDGDFENRINLHLGGLFSLRMAFSLTADGLEPLK